MHKKTFLPVCLLILLVPVTLALGAPGEGAKTPMILSATEEGGQLIIRGANLVAGPDVAPFVTLSGERSSKCAPPCPGSSAAATC